MSGGETSGMDLARVALRAAMEAARKNGGGQKAKRRPRAVTIVRRDGREPMGLRAAIGALVTERAWELPAAGATLRERWAAIAPDLAKHVAAVSYDADSGQLTVRPESSAWATKTRLEQTRVIVAANRLAGCTVVRALRVLPPGPDPMPGSADAVPVGPAPGALAGPMRTKETVSEGVTVARSLRTVRSPCRPGWTRLSRRRWNGRPPRCVRCPAGRSPNPMSSRTTRRLRSSRSAPSAAARLRRLRPQRCGGPEPNELERPYPRRLTPGGRLVRWPESLRRELKKGRCKERRYDVWRHLPRKCAPQAV